MAKNYELNYGWHRLRPTRRTEASTVTLQVDIDSFRTDTWEAVTQWWEALPQDGDLAYAGGCQFPTPVRITGEHATARIASSGQDAFDSIAHHAEELRGAPKAADEDVVITWTELPRS